MSSMASAQRRPALPGRQPYRGTRGVVLSGGRSTKAGPSGPATPPQRSRSRRQTHPRSTKAGPSGPATPGTTGRDRQPDPDAQRRPALPGRQPAVLTSDVASRKIRSTKAGPSGPATPCASSRTLPACQRSTKAGPSGPATPEPEALRRLIDLGHAQRRPALPGRQPARLATTDTDRPLIRSTKAGPSGPATP